jgi:hypothetical protein
LFDEGDDPRDAAGRELCARVVVVDESLQFVAEHVPGGIRVGASVDAVRGEEFVVDDRDELVAEATRESLIGAAGGECLSQGRGA